MFSVSCHQVVWLMGSEFNGFEYRYNSIAEEN